MDQQTSIPLPKSRDNDDLNLAQAAIAKDIEEEPNLALKSADDATLDSEQTPLLRDRDSPDGGEAGGSHDDETPHEYNIETNVKDEIKVLSRSALLMIPTSLLQFSILLATMISIGHIGTVELGAASLGSMTANITGVALTSGLVTSLDTLCAQAYGAGKKKLVGLQVQRMAYFLWLTTVFIGVMWLFAPLLLRKIVPDPEVADLAGRYLRIFWFGLPGYCTYSCGQRFLRAQDNFSATLYIMLFVAPVNAFLNWFLVWHLGIGFDGAAWATVISSHLLWICTVIYVYFVQGLDCWPGLSRQAFRNWGPMVRLSISGVVMVEAEVLAFEILVLVSGYFGTVQLAANSVLFSTINFCYQIPFALSISASTRIAHLIGGRSIKAAQMSTRVAMIGACIIGLISGILLGSLKDYVPRIFSSDPLVIRESAKVMPLCALFLFFDAAGGCAGGVLRGLGRQSAGAYIKLAGHYIIGMPISLGLAFGAHWELWGLWLGLMLSLFWITVVELIFVRMTSWQRIVDDAAGRNESG